MSHSHWMVALPGEGVAAAAAAAAAASKASEARKFILGGGEKRYERESAAVVEREFVRGKFRVLARASESRARQRRPVALRVGKGRGRVLRVSEFDSAGKKRSRRGAYTSIARPRPRPR